MKRMLRTSRLLGCALAVSLAAGCGSSSESRPVNAPPVASSSSSSSSSKARPAAGTPSRSAAAEAVGPTHMRADLMKGKQHVNSALSQLRLLTNPTTTDLNAPFNKYSNDLAALEQHAEKMRKESDKMRESRSEYFATWEDKVSEIDNPTIRASAEARRSRLRDAQERLTTKSGEVRDAYAPLMRDMQDVRKFLAGDLSKQSVSMVSDAANKVQQSGDVLNQKIDALVAELDALDAGAAAGG
jgi:flagellar biosynthesis/type III secretory pathway protein FliH